MKKTISKVAYMGLGALIALLGFILGGIDNSIKAQSDTAVDKIAVRELHIVDGFGNTVAVLGKQHLPNTTVIFRVYNTAGTAVLHLGHDSVGGVINVYGKEGKSAAGLGIDLDGGNLGVSGKKGKLGAILGVYPNGGRVEVYGRKGKGGAGLSITNMGDGIIGTIDKLGNVTGSMP